MNTPNYSGFTSSLNLDPNLQFILREEDMEKAIKQPNVKIVEMALKKAALYGKRVVILTKPQTVYIKDSYDGIDHGKHFPLENLVARSLIEIYEKLHNVSNFDETFYFMPERVVTIVETWENEDDWVLSDPTTEFEFNSAYKNKLGIDMSLSHPAINHHIFETLQCRSDELSIQNIWLPELRNIPLEILLKVRESEEDAFVRFHFALKQLVADLGEAESEIKAMELFQRVDYEVRAIEAKMRQIKKSRALAAYEASLGVSVMGLCLALPSDVSQIIASAIGIYGGKEFISHLFQEKGQIHNLKSSDFYIPWLCTKKQMKD